MTKAIYPGTFDPFTRGHEDLVRRAASLFSSVVVAVAGSRAKGPVFTQEERVALASGELADCPNVQVIAFSGLLVDLVRAQGADVVVRGLRAVSDFEYEFQMAGMNRQLMPGLETVFMTPTDRYQFVSGTLVREIGRMGGEIDLFLSPTVAAAMREKVGGRGAVA